MLSSDIIDDETAAVPAAVSDPSGFKLFLFNIGPDPASVVRVVMEHLKLDADEAHQIVADSPGRLRRIHRPCAAILNELSRRSCGCFQLLSKLRSNNASGPNPRIDRVEEFTFDRGHAFRFAQELRDAGVSVLVIDPAWQ